MLTCGAHGPNGSRCSLNEDHSSPLPTLMLSYQGFRTRPEMDHAEIGLNGEILLWQAGAADGTPVTNSIRPDEVEAAHGSPTAEDGRLGPPSPPSGFTGFPSPRRVEPGKTYVISSPEQARQIEQGVRRDELAQWWRDRAESEIDQTVDKAVEYGAADLVEIGRQLVAAGVRFPQDSAGYRSDAYFAELGIFFYLTGKMARWTSAISEGRAVSNDTLLDIGVYVRMAQRVRQTGQWP